MAIKISGTTVIDDSRNLTNIGTDSLNYPGTDGTAGQVLKTDGAGNLSFGTAGGVLGTLTKSFASGESYSILLSSSAAPAPVVSVTKEIPQTGIYSKGEWDVASSGTNYDRHDTAYDTTLTPSVVNTSAWDVSTASYSQSFSVAAQEGNPTCVKFKPDGLKMYVLGLSGDSVYEYNLSTAWDVSTASYSQSFSISAQTADPYDIDFKTDGLKMYIVGDSVYEYNLSTAWNISTASYSQSFSVTAQDTTPVDIKFKPDGLKMYIVGNSGNSVYEYNLGTAWDVSTALYSQSFSVNSQDTNPYGIDFKPDGSKMYIVGISVDSVHEYNLSTAWDVSTASYSQSFSVAAQDVTPVGLSFKSDGSKMYVLGYSGDSVYEYNLGSSTYTFTLGAGSFSAGDVGKQIEGNGGKAVLLDVNGVFSLLEAFNDYSTIASGDWGMFALTFDPVKGLSMPFTVSGGWDVSAATYSQSFSISAQDAAPVDIKFKPDGSKMYMLGLSGDSVYEYNLGTAWDVSTASYSQSFSVNSQDISPYGIDFKPDGLKMYVLGLQNLSVYEYNLSVAWNILTASYSQSFIVSAQGTGPIAIRFKTDGLKMYIVGNSGDSVHEYNLSTAWNISTASYSQSFSVAAQDVTPVGLSFKSDGSKMYIVGASGRSVYEYNLSTAWDVSTASYSQSFSVSAQDASPYGIDFKTDGLKMYIVGSSGDSVYEYDTGSVLVVTNEYSPAVTNTGGRINSTNWTDINYMTADQISGDGEVYYAVSTDGRSTWKIIHNTNGERLIVRNSAGTWQYNSNTSYASETWTNASTNEELHALQQALYNVVANRMNKDQLEAVTDSNHYTLSTSLDLMISLSMSTASSNIPYSDGVFINYDAEGIYRGAILGTDYDYDFPDDNTVSITSNSAQNLKVKVL